MALIHTTGDGSWFWYARAFGGGQHLYADLHLPMQPLYTIELATLMRIFGGSWLAQQTVGVVNLCIFILSIALVNRHNRWPDWQKAVVYAAAFWATMDFISMRFDDYHVLSASCELLCADGLLRLKPEEPFRRNLPRLVKLGLLCGVCLLNRLNDGALLTAAVVVIAAAWLRGRRERLLAAALVPLVAALVMTGAVVALGETLSTWFYYTVRAAAAIKGGTGSMYLYPLRLPAGTVRELFARGWRFTTLTMYTLLAAAAATWLARRQEASAAEAPKEKTDAVSREWLAYSAVLVVVSLPFAKNIIHGNEARVIVAFAVLGMYGIVFWIGRSAFHHLQRASGGASSAPMLLLLLPIGQLVSISLSAARWYPNTNPPAAVFLLLVPIALPGTLFKRAYRPAYMVLLSLLIVSGAIDKIRDPFDWFYYRSLSVNAPRTWYMHPVYGRMLMEKDQLTLMEPVCHAINANADAAERPKELLSLPFSYANYFCHVQPWHGYMQTFYDTSSRATITGLEAELRKAPPEWIVYQRQLQILHENELAFNRGLPLPHRELDRLIQEQVQQGTWTATQLVSPEYDKSTWLLVHTRGASVAGTPQEAVTGINRRWAPATNWDSHER